MDTTSTRLRTETGQRRRNPRGQGERLREDILDAADTLLAETGDAGKLSLRGVAAQVGIAATSVYLHFPDIGDLKVAVAARGFTELQKARDAASRDIQDPAQALLARVGAYAQFALDYPGRYRLMFGPDLPSTLAYDATSSPTRQALHSLATSIERCQKAGVSRPGDDPVQVAIMVWAAVHGGVLLRMDRPQFPWPPLNQMVDATVRRLVGIDAP